LGAVVRRFLALLVTTAALAAACGGGSDSSPGNGQAKPRPAVREISNVLALRAAFNADHGKPRLLLIFSPT
jgi:hypothetical protein